MAVQCQHRKSLLVVAILCSSSAMLGKCIQDPHPLSLGRQYWQQGYKIMIMPLP
jgi:hypothetical protein